MNSRNGLVSKKLDGFLAKLSELVGALPSPDEKARIDNDLKALIGYLEGIRKQLALVPTDRQFDSSSIDRLRELLRTLNGDPVLSRALGLAGNGRRAYRRTDALGEAARIRAEEAAKELKALSGDEVRSRLLDKSYSVALLRQIGGELGIRIPSKANRASVIDTIAGKLANRRGYDILRHGRNP